MQREEVYRLIETHYRLHYEDLIKKLENVCGNLHNAQDVVQEAYTRALEYWNSFNVDLEFARWFSRILVNCVARQVMEERQHGMSEAENEIVDNEVFNKVLSNEMLALIAQQPRENGYILRLYFQEQYKTVDIEKVVPQSHVAIRKIIERFRKLIKECDG